MIFTPPLIVERRISALSLSHYLERLCAYNTSDRAVEPHPLVQSRGGGARARCSLSARSTFGTLGPTSPPLARRSTTLPSHALHRCTQFLRTDGAIPVSIFAL